MLTVRNAERDKVLALDGGRTITSSNRLAMQELLARIRAALRRRVSQAKETSFTAKTLDEFRSPLVTVLAMKFTDAERVRIAAPPRAECGQASDSSQAAASRLGSGYGDEPEYLQ